MLINNHSKNTYYPNFSANLLISGNKSLLSDEEISTLSKRIEPLGKKDDSVELNIGSDIIDWFEINSQNRPKKVLSGYKMSVKTSISGVKDRDLSTADIQQRFWENYSEFSPFGVVGNWIDSIKNKTKFNLKSININPSLYNANNSEWINCAALKTPDSKPQKPKVDLEKCQAILDAKIYGDMWYQNILGDANNNKTVKISADDIIDKVVLNEGYSKDELKEKIAAADSYNDSVKKSHTQTKNLYSDENGVYTPERQIIHSKILDDIFANSNNAKPKNGNQPTFIMIGGRGGSGKTRFGKQGYAKVYDNKDNIVLNSDEIKKRLPEYKGYNSFEIHEESWDIVNKALQLSQKKGLNVVLDGTISDFTSNEKILKQFANAGYNIEMYFMYLPREKAAERALIRFNYNNRYVPLEILLNMKDNEKNFDELKQYASKWAFYSNDVDLGKEPLLIDFENQNLLELLLQKCQLDK